MWEGNNQECILYALVVRKITAADKDNLFILANDQVVRSQSFSTKPVTWKEHCKWFEKQLNKSANESRVFIVYTQNECVGKVQFTKELKVGKEYTISIALMPSFRGKGLGSFLLSHVSKLFWQEIGLEPIIAFIKTDNVASQRAFQKAGFVFQQETCVNGVHTCLQFVKRPS